MFVKVGPATGSMRRNSSGSCSEMPPRSPSRVPALFKEAVNLRRSAPKCARALRPPAPDPPAPAVLEPQKPRCRRSLTQLPMFSYSPVGRKNARQKNKALPAERPSLWSAPTQSP